MAKRSGARIVTVIIIALIVVALAFGLYYVTDGFTNWNLNVNCIAGNHKFDDEGVCVSCGRQGVQDLTLFVDGLPTDGVVQSHMFSENIGLTYQLTCVVKPENAIQAKVSYTSDNEAVATVNDKGIVTIVSEGEATVTASVKRGISVQCKFVIDGSGYPDELVFEQNEYYFDTAYLETDRLRRHTVRISEEASDEFANGLEIIWASSNENVATVFAVSPTIKNAAIILRGEGTATITATMPNGVSATAQVYVGKRLNLTLKDFDPETVKIGDQYQMGCEWLPKQTVVDTVSNWYSSNSDVATIDRYTGLVTIVGYGEVTFSADVNAHSTAVDTSLTINVMSPKIETLVYTSEVTDITMSTKPWKNSFGATYSPADANTSNLQITTSDESIAVANITRAADGEVVFSVEYYSAGTVDIILTCEDKSITLTQTVTDDSIAKIVTFLDYPENVGLTESEPTKTVEVKIAITSSVRDINKIIITSSNENVVSVADIRKDEETSAVTEYTDDFIITLNCLSEGSATIRVTYDYIYNELDIVVSQLMPQSVLIYGKNDLLLNSEVLYMSTNSLENPAEYKLTSVIEPANVSQAVTWTSSDESAVTVDENGLITAVGAGEAIITATAINGVSASCNVIVNVYVEELAITGNYEPYMQGFELYVGSNAELQATVSPASANRTDLRWTSDNESVATVNDNGVVTAVSEGVATITVSDNLTINRPSAQIVVYVSVPVESIDLHYETSMGVWNMNIEPASQVLLPVERAEQHVGLDFASSLTLTAFVTPTNATVNNDYVSHPLRYTSSDTSVATVDSNGNVLAKRVGTAVITVSADSGVSASITVSVLRPNATLQDISMSVGNSSLLEDLYYTFFEASSSNTAVATLANDGVLTAHGAGTAQITVTFHSATDYNETVQSIFNVTVSEDPETFAEYSWSRISELSANGQAAERFNVGDEKEVTLANDETLTFVILGFNHDVDVNSNAVGLTFGLKNLYSSTSAMNETNSNTASSLMSDKLSSIYELLPEDLQAVIKTVQKQTSAGGKSRTIKTTEDKLFLFSEKEVFGTYAGSFDGEGTQYAYFAQNTNRVLTINGTASNWLLRSPTKDSYTTFRGVYQSGAIGNINANTAAGICFGFCI